MSHIFVAWSLDVSGNALIFCLRGYQPCQKHLLLIPHVTPHETFSLLEVLGWVSPPSTWICFWARMWNTMKTYNQSEEIGNWVKPIESVNMMIWYIYIYIYINIYTMCIWYVYVSCLGSFGWIKFNEGTLHGSKSSLPGPWPHVTALHVGSEPAAFLWDYSLGLWIFECHWTCCEIWKKVLWYILIYQSIMNSIMNFSTKDLGAKWHLIFLAQHGESQCCWPNWRMGPSPCAPLQLPS